MGRSVIARAAGLVGVAALAALAAPRAVSAQGAAPAAAPAAATANGAILWRLRNPFRYFKKPEHWALYASAAHAQHHGGGGETSKSPVLATERSLSAKTDGHGWAAGIFEHVVDEACWYRAAGAAGATAGKAAPSAEPCGDYIKPKAHVVLLQAPSIAKACTWTIGTTVIAKPDCRQPAEASIPYPDGADVTLASDGAPIATQAIKVEDLLVVGLGDSYGAGDGNPDRPVSFRVNRPMSYDTDRDGYPQRYDLTSDVRYTDVRFRNKGAGWVHRNCHRSLYSHQLRTALHLALDDAAGQRSVTYLGLACSGATMLSMFNVYGGYDEPGSAADLAHSKRQIELSQIDILAHALCAPGQARLDTSVNYNADSFLEIGDRAIHVHACEEGKRLRKPDLVLLSIGGNDVGFAGLITNAAMRGQFLGYVKLFDEDPRITPENAKVFMGRVPGRYASLAKALHAVTGTDPAHVLLSAYPDMHEDHDGHVCGTGTRGFDVSVAWTLQNKAVAATQHFMQDTLTPAMAKAAAAAGWRFASGHRDDGSFKRRGICALTARELEDPALANVQFPRFREQDGTGTWSPFKPSEYRAYAARQRLFLTPNDAFLAAHYHTRHIPIMDGGPEVQLALWSAYSGAFHPTAEGQAAIADAVLAQARRAIPPPSPSP